MIPLFIIIKNMIPLYNKVRHDAMLARALGCDPRGRRSPDVLLAGRSRPRGDTKVAVGRGSVLTELLGLVVSPILTGIHTGQVRDQYVYWSR